jgi:hypothetical protein
VPSPSGRLIDIGSGSSEFVYAAQLLGFDGEGIEPHLGYSAYAAKTFGIPIRNSSWQEADIAPESTHVVTLHHVLEHLRDPFAVLACVSGLLKPDGLIAIDVPDIETTYHAPRNRFHYAHIYNFNHATLAALLDKAGFELADTPANHKGTMLAARKVRSPDPLWPVSLPANYERLYKQLIAGLDAVQYQTRKPLDRLLRKVTRFPEEVSYGFRISNPREIVRREVSGLLQPA